MKMNKELGPKEKFLVLNGLVCLVQSLEGKQTTVDLRNETSVYGRIEDVDAYMNIRMSNVIFTNWKAENQRFENFYIQARNIRYVHIPKQIPIVGAIKKQIGKVATRGDERGRQMTDKSFKMKRVLKKQQETIAMIDKLKEERLKKSQEKEEKG